MRDKLEKLNRNDLLTILGMILLAFLLWLFVMGDTNPNITQEHKNISVRYVNKEALTRNNLALMNPEDIKVNVKISGNRADFKHFDASNIEAVIDLNGYAEGERKASIKVSLNNQYSKVGISDFYPREALIILDKIVTKEIPIELNYEGSLPDGYVLGNTSVKPQSVLVSGPRSWISGIAKAQAMVSLSGKNRDITMTTPLKIIDDKGEEAIGIKRNPNVAEVSLPVLKTADVPIFIELLEGEPDGYEIRDIEIEPKSVTIKGSDGIEEIKGLKTREIDMNKFLDPDFTNVPLDLPEGISLLNPNEEIKISYTVYKLLEELYEVPRSSVSVKNIGGGLNFEIDREDTIELTLRSREEIIKDLDIGDIYPYIDLTGLGKGTHYVEIRVNDIEGALIDVVEAEKIKVIIE